MLSHLLLLILSCTSSIGKPWNGGSSNFEFIFEFINIFVIYFKIFFDIYYSTFFSNV